MSLVEPQRSPQRTTTPEKVMKFMPRRNLGRIGAFAALATFAAACAEDKPLNTFEPKGPKAQGIYDLMTPIWIIMGIVFVIVIFGTIGLAIKGRVKPEDFDENDLPDQIHGHFLAEISWTIAPAILLAVISVPMVSAIWELEKKNDVGELDVMVIGNQWWWEYRYDVDGDGFFIDANENGLIYGPNGYGADGIKDTGDEDTQDQEWSINDILDPDDLSVPNQMVIPAGQQIDLTLTSRDVVHSFWIPRLNGKRDTVPGRLTYWSIDADAPGEYNGWCTEFCGLSHARMRMSVIALPEEEFELWLENQVLNAEVPEEPAGEEKASAERDGYDLFVSNCASCHVLDNDDPDLQETYADDFEAALVSGAAPNLTHFATRSVYAGAIYSQYSGIDPDDDNLDVSTYLELAGTERLNEAELKAWISDAPSQKAMYAEGLRGMPSFPSLTEHDLDNLVAFLATLD